MQDDLFKFPLEVSYKPLEQINGVKFTSREIDVVACIISGRAATKTIASLLSIESKTVEVHTRNIRLKLECNSREGIVQFIEKAGKFSAARHHYLLLLIQSAFEQKLQKVSALVMQKKLSCLILYEKQYELFINQLKKYFKRLGVEGVFRLQEADKPLKDSLQGLNSHSLAHCLFVTSPLQLKQVLRKESLEDTTLSQVLQHPEAITFISLGEQSKEMSQERDEIDCTDHIHFGNAEQYYLSFFDLFKRIFPEVALDKLMSEFKEQYDILTNEPSGKRSLILVSEEKDLEQKEQFFNHLFINLLKKGAGRLLISGVFCLIIFFALILIFKGNKPDPSLPLQQVHKSKAIRSDLPLLHDTVLLKRPEIMKQIEEKLKGDQGIQTIALVGIGGAGKTTIARHYAHQQDANVIWEINAETTESLINSFENLAYALAQTEDEQKILRGLQDIKNFDNRVEKIVFFIKERLKTYPNWFLVYDNVEKFSDIQKYFPTDPKVWGKGKSIVTTRDSNIGNNSHIHYAFPVGELNEKEKLSLFMNIMSHGNVYSLSSGQRDQIQEFLTKIPPFPLDISAAVHYLKATNISYQEYLERLRKQDKDFDNTQQNILKEVNEYDKTRQKIIQLSLENLVKINKDFEELLLFISLIDSQNIPRDLLNSYKSNSTIDNFIFHLKKYSFITIERSAQTTKTFSIHRSIQKIFLAYFVKSLNLTKGSQPLSLITGFLENYLINIIDKEDCLKINFLVNHCEKFLENNDLLSNNIKYHITAELGRIYFYLGYFFKAKQIFEDSIKNLDKNYYENYTRIAKASRYLGNCLGELGEYKKAIFWLEKSLIIYEKHFSKNHIRVAEVLGYLGNNYKSLGDYKKAKSFFEKNIEIYKQHYTNNHPKIAQVATYLGNINRELGNYKNAKNLLDKALIIYTRNFSKDHFRLAQIYIYLGNFYKDIGNYKEAKTLFEQSLIIYKKQFSETNSKVIRILEYLGDIHTKLGNYKEAKSIIEKVLLVHENYYGRNHIRVFETLKFLGNIYKELKDYKKAKSFFERSLASYENYYGKDHIETARLLIYLGQVYFLEGQLESAESSIRRALRIFEDGKHPENYLCLENLADLYYRKFLDALNKEKKQEAEDLKIQIVKYLEDAFRILKENFPENSPHIQRMKFKIKRFEISN